MRKRWPIAPCVLALSWLAADTALAREGKKVTPKELLKQGFFQDFQELDLETLLAFSDITLSVATRSEQAPDEAPGAVSIVTSDDIKAMGARSLDEALQAVPGVDVTYDALGRPRITMRGLPTGATGGASENVLILMNGQRIDDPIEGGATSLEFTTPVGNIQKIEVLRGAGSALYGSGAMGGVVNIITFTQRDFTGIEANAGIGSFTTQDYSLRLGSEGRTLKIAGYINFQHGNGARRTVGADAQTAIDEGLSAQGVAPASLAPGRERDNFKIFETNYTASYKDYEFQLRVGTQRSPGAIGIADALGDANDMPQRKILIGASHRRDLPDGWTLDERASYEQFDARRSFQAFPAGFTLLLGDQGSVTYPSGVFAQEDLSSRRFGVDATAQKTIPQHAIQMGLGIGRESTFNTDVRSNYDFRTAAPMNQLESIPGAAPEKGRGLVSLYAQDVWSRFSKVTLTGGLRFDHYGGVGGVVSPRLAAVFRLPKAVSLKVLYARGFRMPTFAEQYFDLPGYLGNPSLKPMTSDTLEASVSYAIRRLRLSGGLFQTFLRDEILAEGDYVPGSSRPIVNGPGRDVRGLELELRQGFGVASSLFLDYAYQHSDDKATGVASAGVPASVGHVGATFAFARSLRATPSLVFGSSRPRAVGDTRSAVPGYALLDFALRAPDVYRGLLLSLSGRNLLNKSYFGPAPDGGVPGDYPRPGRTLFLSASYQF
jgi:outer membrane receptor for ferrienterochelin and colicins